MSDNRKSSRLGIELDVELVMNELLYSLQTRDLSNGGVFLKKGDHDLPPKGAVVKLRVKSNLADGEPPLVKAEVVRVEDDGIALAFLSDE